jgi:hypothetical protein
MVRVHVSAGPVYEGNVSVLIKVEGIQSFPFSAGHVGRTDMLPEPLKGVGSHLAMRAERFMGCTDPTTVQLLFRYTEHLPATANLDTVRELLVAHGFQVIG